MPSDGGYLDTNLLYLPGVGEKKARILFEELGLVSYRDLLEHFPFRFVDRTQVYKVAQICGSDADIQLRGYIVDYSLEGYGRKAHMRAVFKDDTGQVDLIWFKGANYLPESYPPGKEYIIYGRPRLFRHRYSITHPEVTPVHQAHMVTEGLMGVYNTTMKMKRVGLDSRGLRKIILSLLPIIPQYLTETLAPELIAHFGLVPLATAMQQMHQPQSLSVLSAAKMRLKFDELFYYQLSRQRLKQERKNRFVGHKLDKIGSFFNGLHASLPFTLTGAQQRVIREIYHDCRSGLHMNRLVEGDVGSGKTLVAAFAMMLALDSGHQACLMAPTEILAQQHLGTLQELLLPLGIGAELLTGSTSVPERRRILEATESGELQILIGTHALLEERVRFRSLALAVIDEQHRFGVEQRARLWEKSSKRLPHILIMSATPIPRTLSMTLYGDLDLSIIDELPPGRRPIETFHLFDHQSDKAYNFIRDRLVEGCQIYVVYPMIEGTEESDFKNLETGYRQFAYMFGENNVTWVHGKLNSKDKQAQMQAFVEGRVPILLSTTVIEVGVNVPNATVMLIESAERFGLAQLHQLRGRVGRGSRQSYCLLMTKDNLSYPSRRRIEVMCGTTDGFRIAEEDMRLRGAGDMEGTRQSGELPGLKLTDLAVDGRLVALTAATVQALLEADPRLEHPANQIYKEEVLRRFPPGEQWGNIS